MDKTVEDDMVDGLFCATHVLWCLSVLLSFSKAT